MKNQGHALHLHISATQLRVLWSVWSSPLVCHVESSAALPPASASADFLHEGLPGTSLLYQVPVASSPRPLVRLKTVWYAYLHILTSRVPIISLTCSALFNRCLCFTSPSPHPRLQGPQSSRASETKFPL